MDAGTTTRRLTPEEVLTVFADLQRQAVADGEADRAEPIGFDTPVAAWVDACDLRNDMVLLEGRWLARLLNRWFRIHVPDAEWRNVLRPRKTRTLGDVCRLIAEHATVDEIRPARILGRECLAAGAFFALRRALKRAGSDVSALRPSTRLDELMRHDPHAVQLEALKLAPGQLPPLVLSMGPSSLGCMLLIWLFFIGWIILIGGAFLASSTPGVVVAVTGLVLVFAAPILAYALKPVQEYQATWGSMRDVGDLCCAMVGLPPRRRRFEPASEAPPQ